MGEIADGQTNEPVEDPVPGILAKATIGTTAVHIQKVDAGWDRDHKNMETNRPLDQEHVEKIAESMISNLMIADAANRICISMAEKEFYEVVIFAALNKIYNETPNKHIIDHKAKKFQDKIDARAKQIAERIKKKRIYAIIEEYPLLRWHADDAKQPILYRDQHR